MLKAGDKFRAVASTILENNEDSLDRSTIFVLAEDGYGYYKLKFNRKDTRYGYHKEDSFCFRKDEEKFILTLFKKIEDSPILNDNDYYS